MNNCALFDYNPPPAPDCVTQVTPNRQLDQAILDQGLREVEQLLQAQGGKTLEDFELPIPTQLIAPGDAAVSEERAKYNVTRQVQQLARDVPLLNQHQRSIYDNVIDAVHDPKPVDKTFFVDGLGGAGKTFLYGCFCVTPRRLHSNGFLSRESQSGVSKLFRFGLPGFWTVIASRPDLRSGRGLNQCCSSRRELSNVVSHSPSAHWERVDSRLLMVENQTANLTLGLSFAHNLGCICPNDSGEAILDIYTSRPFQWYQEHLNARCFDPYNRLLSF